MKTCRLHTGLVGRYAVGAWREDNDAYVDPEDRKKKVRYTDDQLHEYNWHRVIEPIIAVTLDTAWIDDHYGDWLKLWVLVDGTPRWLGTSAKVMPAGWEPNLR